MILIPRMWYKDADWPRAIYTTHPAICQLTMLQQDMVLLNEPQNLVYWHSRFSLERQNLQKLFVNSPIVDGTNLNNYKISNYI